MGKSFALRAVAASLLLAVGACTRPIPEIGRGLSQKVPEGQDAFDKRIKARFRIGSASNDMVEVLREQGFEESSYPQERFRTLDYRNGGFPVHTLWSVRWREEQGRVTEVWGVFGPTGP